MRARTNVFPGYDNVYAHVYATKLHKPKRTGNNPHELLNFSPANPHYAPRDEINVYSLEEMRDNDRAG